MKFGTPSVVMHRKPDARNMKKDQFWETIDSEMQAVNRSERLVVVRDLNGDVGSDRIGRI